MIFMIKANQNIKAVSANQWKSAFIGNCTLQMNYSKQGLSVCCQVNFFPGLSGLTNFPDIQVWLTI